MFTQIKLRFSEVLALGAAIVSALEGILDVLSRAIAAIEGFQWPDNTPAEPKESPQIAILEARMNELTGAVAEGVQRVQRSESRIRSIVQGARRELQEHGFEHPGVEAEAEQLQLVNESDREQEQVPAVQESVADDSQLPSSVPGISLAQMRRIRR